ncbi:energy-coupling factor transporter transmembrane protein EcfT [Methanogenium marinum]|uniref:Energy-coupling factor transporter transmembrane protein EcfT n=1 Tax=Methanogenium marinum TaxID=348610 RepID=A0A9Q4PYJ4_9EURY|nr:energy-coupling factor transporter transmembrane component T [Methanogenium marinum]MDE4908833.1 energy-coupling factor transporter transmembrane protein EcfT [Methanogenium marinum]
MKGQKKKKGILYIPGDSPVHSLDPRTKLLMLVVFSIMSFLTTNLFVMVLLLVCIVALAYTSGLFDKWVYSLRLLLPLIIFVFVMDLFFSHESAGAEFFSAQIWFIHAYATEGSLYFSASMIMRLLIIAGFSFLFIMTTKYSDFVKSLQSMKVPHIISFSLGYALSSTTTLSRDANNVIDAQKSRGLEFDRGSPVKKIDKLLSLFIPMTVIMLNRSNQVSDAMQCRGYGNAEKPSLYNAPVLGADDIMAIIVIAFFTVLIIILIHFVII